MLWGRRSERRSDSPDQRQLDFGDGPDPPPSAEDQEIVTAQDQADEARDRELLKRLETRRKARREQAQGREEFPPTIERRERVPQPLHGERSDELRRGHDRPFVPADVASRSGDTLLISTHSVNK